MEIQCECGKFRAELVQFPKSTPGRLKCYCDDCQTYLHYLKRGDLLDVNAGTEIIPYYPADVKITAGKELLRCVRLHPKGMYRFSTTCCNTPVANTQPGRPWAGFMRRLFTAKDPSQPDKTLSEVRSSIFGKYAKGTPPAGTPETFNFKGFTIVMPYILKGVFMGKGKHSPFFSAGNSISPVKVLTLEERNAARVAAGV